MEVYFVRHGQTDGNVAHRHQHQDTRLNEVGKLQVQALVDKIAKINPTHIFCSTNIRAVETTKIIVTKFTTLIPETNTVFEELHRPTWLTGNRYFSLSSVVYIVRWFYSLKIQGDLETHDDFVKRVIEARTYLESLPEDSKVVVVSHSIFINFFLEHLCTNKKMRLLRASRRLLQIFKVRNASLIHLHYQKSENKCGWQVLEK